MFEETQKGFKWQYTSGGTVKCFPGVRVYYLFDYQRQQRLGQSRRFDSAIDPWPTITSVTYRSSKAGPEIDT